jgi:hypothetical protein
MKQQALRARGELRLDVDGGPIVIGPRDVPRSRA